MRRQDTRHPRRLAIGLAHEINNPLEVIVNNLNLIEKHVARVSSDEDFLIESERFDSTYGAVSRIQHIVNKLNDLAHGTEYATREYLPGTEMTDLGGGMPALPGASSPTRDRRVRAGRCRIWSSTTTSRLPSLGDLSPRRLRRLVATGGREGLAKLTGGGDLVLNDVVMPDLDGYELFRNRAPSGPAVVLMTLHDRQGPHHQAQQARRARRRRLQEADRPAEAPPSHQASRAAPRHRFRLTANRGRSARLWWTTRGGEG